MKKYIGDIYWIGGNYKGVDCGGVDSSKVNRALLEKDTFKIDHGNPNGAQDSLITLRTKNGFNYDGSMKFIDDNKHAAVVNLKMYTNNKEVILIGDWIENSKVFNCIIELTEVKDF